MVGGVLRDAKTGEFLPYVNVAVLDSIDSTFVKGGISNMDGRFELTEVPQGAFLLRVSAIGYENYVHPFHVSNNTDLGVLRTQRPHGGRNGRRQENRRLQPVMVAEASQG